MSEYRIRSTGEVKTQSQILKDYPNTSLPKIWNEDINNQLGIDPVLQTPQPQPSDDYKVVIKNGVEQDSGNNWVWAWTETDMFSDYTDSGGNVVTVQNQIDAMIAQDNESLAAAERETRNNLLKATDHYGLSDVTMTEAMTTYRQALRDVPQQVGFPNTITWPTLAE